LKRLLDEAETGLSRPSSWRMMMMMMMMTTNPPIQHHTTDVTYLWKSR
jgi:hypothetical protein